MSENGSCGFYIMCLVIGSLAYMAVRWGWLGFIGGIFILFYMIQTVAEVNEDK